MALQGLIRAPESLILIGKISGLPRRISNPHEHIFMGRRTS